MRGEAKRYYVCTAYRTRGATVCQNRHPAPMPDLDAVVLTTVRREILDPKLARDVVRRALELRAKQPTTADRRSSLRAELERLEQELRRYAEAIGAGETMPVILEAMRTRERRRVELTAQLAALSERQATVTPADVYRKLSQRLTDWHGLLDGTRRAPATFCEWCSSGGSW